jgi:hypothetical protein
MMLKAHLEIHSHKPLDYRRCENTQGINVLLKSFIIDILATLTGCHSFIENIVKEPIKIKLISPHSSISLLIV